MGSKTLKIGLLVLCAFCCHLDHQINKPTSLADAFLFHQLPIHTSLSSSSRENSSTTSDYLSNTQQYNSRQVDHMQNERRNYKLRTRESVGLNDDEMGEKNIAGCPTECHCNKQAQIADCSNRNLIRVPTGFPKDIKRIRLERNNISELGPYAFQGLKRVQRIDLSNNNLLKIDPLAFSGGLQSLNSLILYSNRLSHLPASLFSELSQLQLLLLNANSLQCISKELFQSLSNLNLLSLYDNNIETLVNGTFDGLRNIKTIHLAKNPLVCDCNLRWLADYLELNPIETSEARCEGPARNQGKKLSQLGKQKFKCEGQEQSKTNLIASICAAQNEQSSCPNGCACDGSTIDCSPTSMTESKASGGIYELPDIPDDLPVYVTRIRINDNRIKRIRQSQLFRRLANSQKLDLGNNRIIDIEDNAINGGAGGSTKPERVVFVLLQNDACESRNSKQPEDACSSAPKVNPPNFDSPCYNGGSCLIGARSTGSNSNYSCLCPPGFDGPLCEINIDDCTEHQCQNGGMCVDGINSYKCVCRDPTTSGEYCEQLNSFTSNSANSIAPIALPMISSRGQQQSETIPVQPQHQQQQISTRSADSTRDPIELASSCKRVTSRRYFDDGNGCQSVRMLKINECSGTCGGTGCSCMPAKVKRRRVRMQCNDGASYVKTIDLVKKCSCSTECNGESINHHQQQNVFQNHFNASKEDQLLQITRLDAVD